MNLKVFKKMASALPSGTDKDYSLLVVANKKLIVSDGIIIVSYNIDEGENKVGLTPKDFNNLDKFSGETVYFKDKIYIDEEPLEEPKNFLIFNDFDRLYNKAINDNMHTLPLLKLEECKCELIAINSFGVHYINDGKIIKSTPLNAPGLLETPLGYVSFQYKYFRSLMNVFKYFKIMPVFKFGSSYNIVFESNKIKGILMQYRIVNTKLDLKNAKCLSVSEDW